MSQKYIKSQNKNSHNAKTFGKYYAKPVYHQRSKRISESAAEIESARFQFYGDGL